MGIASRDLFRVSRLTLRSTKVLCLPDSPCRGDNVATGLLRLVGILRT